MSSKYQCATWAQNRPYSTAHTIRNRLVPALAMSPQRPGDDAVSAGQVVGGCMDGGW